MSIIYDALKKVENPEIKPKVKPPLENLNLNSSKQSLQPKNSKAIYIVIPLVLVSIILLTKSIIGATSNKPTKVAPQTPPATMKIPSSTSRLTLNGIVYDNKRSYAIVNNEVVRIGDSIKGAKIIRILPKAVEFEVKGKTIILKSGE